MARCGCRIEASQPPPRWQQHSRRSATVSPANMHGPPNAPPPADEWVRYAERFDRVQQMRQELRKQVWPLPYDLCLVGAAGWSAVLAPLLPGHARVHP